MRKVKKENSIDNKANIGGRADGKRKRDNSIKLIAGCGVFAALALIVSFATSFIKVQFLSLDLGDAVIILASFIYGPLSGVGISAVSSLISFLYSGTGPWGLLMDFVSSATFAFVASFIYSRRKSFSSAILGIYAAVAVVTIVMVPMNILVTPLYTGAPMEYIISLLVPLLVPFNFTKALLNGGIALILYKPLVRAMRRSGMLPPSGNKAIAKSNRYTVISLCIGLGTLAVCIPVLIILALTAVI